MNKFIDVKYLTAKCILLMRMAGTNNKRCKRTHRE